MGVDELAVALWIDPPIQKQVVALTQRSILPAFLGVPGPPLLLTFLSGPGATLFDDDDPGGSK